MRGIRRSTLRGMAAVGLALAGGGLLWAHMRQPATVLLAQATRPVGAGEPLTPADVRAWRTLAPAPPGAVPLSAIHGQRLRIPVVPGDPILRADFGAGVIGLRPGEVRLVLPVQPGPSGLVRPGDRVTVLGVQTPQGGGTGTGTVAVLARNVRVLGVYQSNGAPLNPTSSAFASGADAPGLVAVAAPPAVVRAVGPYLNAQDAFWLLKQPAVSQP